MPNKTGDTPAENTARTGQSAASPDTSASGPPASGRKKGAGKAAPSAPASPSGAQAVPGRRTPVASALSPNDVPPVALTASSLPARRAASKRKQAPAAPGPTATGGQEARTGPTEAGSSSGGVQSPDRPRTIGEHQIDGRALEAELSAAAAAAASNEAGGPGTASRASEGSASGGGAAKGGTAAADGESAQDELPPSAPFAFPKSVHLSPQRIAQLQTEYLQRLQSIMTGQGEAPSDRRFSGDAWREGPFSWAAKLYLLNSEFMQKMAESIDGDARVRERIRFATQQWVDAMSPANYLATNPEAQRRLVETRGDSLVQGMRHMLEDLQKGRITHTDETVFEVGRNMATTPGDVVYENELFQLIQYTPTTTQVGKRPLLMVPPCINKFYILDLQPANSLVAWAVSQGHTVFLLSWRNPDSSMAELGWDDYLEKGIVRAVQVSREIADIDRINALGFCVGGTLLSNAAAMMAGRGERMIESMTLLTTLLDFSNPGALGVFIDENFVSFREQTIGKRGILPGRELATTFNYLRPNDLVWNYVVSKYLKGEDPPAFDLLYWNADSTNMTGPMYCWYLRHTYLQNDLRIPGRVSCGGVPIDLGAIEVPTYLYASREDHIVPWQGAYESTRLLSGPLRFTLGASGHIAGVINPPAPNKRSHWTSDSLPERADDWFESATEHRGSWWTDWGRWLQQFNGGTKPAPAQAGNARYRPIEPAPGRYVKEKAE
jgi:polyhydroxyalkanoate synthase